MSLVRMGKFRNIDDNLGYGGRGQDAIVSGIPPHR